MPFPNRFPRGLDAFGAAFAAAIPGTVTLATGVGVMITAAEAVARSGTDCTARCTAAAIAGLCREGRIAAAGAVAVGDPAKVVAALILSLGTDAALRMRDVTVESAWGSVELLVERPDGVAARVA